MPNDLDIGFLLCEIRICDSTFKAPFSTDFYSLALLVHLRREVFQSLEREVVQPYF